MSYVGRQLFEPTEGVGADDTLPARRTYVDAASLPLRALDQPFARSGGEQSFGEYHTLLAFIEFCNAQVVILNSAMQVLIANKSWSRSAMQNGALNDLSGRVSFDFLSPDRAVVRRIERAVKSMIAGEAADARILYQVGRGSARRHLELQVVPLRLHSQRAVTVFNRDVSEIHALMDDKRVLIDQLMRSEENERRRIAREMHDSTVQDLVAIGLNLKRLKHLDGDTLASEVISDINEILVRTQRDVRTLSYLLHPPLLDDGGISLALGALVRGLANRMEARIRYETTLPNIRYPSDIELALYRVAQEALMNVHRHASATDAIVSVSLNSDHIELEIEDNGVGIGEPEAHRTKLGVGIQAMQGRIEQLNGRFSISRVERGTRVYAAVPLGRPS